MSILLHECLSLSESGRSVRVDRDRGTIGPVKALGFTSLNGRKYLKEGVAASLYEGRRVCVGHFKGGGDRPPTDTVGLLEGARVEDDGVYADRLRLLDPAGPFEKRLLAAAESAPHLFGLSHTARGRERQGSAGRIIEAVESVESVDLVTDPATVKGLYESRAQPVKISELIESLKDRRPRYVQALREAVEAGVASPDLGMDAPPGEAGPADHETAILDAAAAVLRDDALSVPDKLKKIKALLKMTEGGGGMPDESADAEESRKRKADANLKENEQFKAEKLVRKAAGEARVPLTEALVEALARPGMTDAQAKAVISELKGAQGERPRSASPVPPAGGGGGAVRESKAGGEIPTDPKARAAWLARG